MGEDTALIINRIAGTLVAPETTLDLDEMRMDVLHEMAAYFQTLWMERAHAEPLHGRPMMWP